MWTQFPDNISGQCRDPLAGPLAGVIREKSRSNAVCNLKDTLNAPWLYRLPGSEWVTDQ